MNPVKVLVPPQSSLNISPWKRWYYKNERGLLGVLGIVIVIILWEILGQSGAVNPTFTSSPSLIWVAGVDYFSAGTAWNDLRVSGTEFIFGFGLAILIGIPVGMLMGWYNKLNALLDPLFNFIYSAPRIALMPVFIIWFGIDTTSKVAIIFLGAVFPIIINTLVGVKTIDSQLLNVARSYKASDLQIIRTIILPSSVPSIISGIRLGLGHALIGIVVGEMVASTAGVGFTMTQAGNSFRTDLVFFCLILISGCGVIFTELLRRLERKFDKWRPELRR